jgi:crotonobetainyl-CoA:carnitine CoA-transferase CaiB-like acyl-CoA transferase
MNEKALPDIKVIDLTHALAGPYCTKLLAGFGADVIKIELPETGDRMRGFGPFFGNKEGPETSIPFLWLNTGKKSVTLNLKTDQDREVFKKLVIDADVVVENFSPGTMSDLGLGYELLREINPRLIMASISNFGQTGPYRDYKACEIQEYAMSGLMHMTGETNKPPLASGPAICQYTAGLYAYNAILMALFQRQTTQRGQYIDISIMEASMENIETRLANYLYSGKDSKRGAHTFAPWGLYSCQDGYITIIGAPFRHWKSGAVIFQDSRLLEDKYRLAIDRAKYREEINGIIIPWAKARKKKEIFKAGSEHKFAFGYVAGFSEVMVSSQHKERKFFVEIDHPVVGKHKYCGAPFKMSRTPYMPLRSPLLGEHNQAIREEISKITKIKDADYKNKSVAQADGLPLKGMRVIDLTHSWAGPHCTRVLADFGAEVIRVEYIRRLCMFRGGTKENQAYNKQPSWFHLNRNKCSVTLDLNIEQDKRDLKELIKAADVFIENSRTGIMEKLGFNYKELIKINPDIIMVSMAAYGNTGPDAALGAYGAALEAMSGIQNLTGYGADDKPERIREMDVVNGIGASCAIMTALLYRQKTGYGQHVDFSQMEFSTHALIGEHLLEYAMNNTRVPALGNRHRSFAPQGCYRSKGEDKWITLTVRSDEEWQRFCEAVGHPEWKTDPHFACNSARMENHDELDRLIGEWTLKYTHYEAMRIIQNYNIAAGAVLDLADIKNDPHLKQRGYLIPDVNEPEKQSIGMPFKLSKGAGRVRWRGPDLGQHNEYVLCEILGQSKDEIRPINTEEIGTAYDS